MANIYTPDPKIAFPDNAVDLFGRLRVSSPETQIQIKQDSTINRELTTSHGFITANAQMTGTAVDNYFQISSTGTSGHYRLRSKLCGLYQNGKSLIIFFTFNFVTTGTTGVIKRAGYFNGSSSVDGNVNGIRLEQRGTEVYWILGSTFTNSKIEVAQSAWNGEALTLDWTKAQIGYISFEYLGVGDIVVGFVQDREFKIAHIFSNKNNIEIPYMGTPNLFICYEMLVNRATTNQERFRAICANCLIEGGQQRTGYPFSISKWDSVTIDENEDTVIAVFRNTILNHRVLLNDFEIGLGADSTSLVSIVEITTIGTLGTSAGVINGVEYWFPTNEPAFTGKYILSSATAKGSRQASSVFSLNTYLETNYNDTPIYYAIVATCTTKNLKIQPILVNFILET